MYLEPAIGMWWKMMDASASEETMYLLVIWFYCIQEVRNPQV